MLKELSGRLPSSLYHNWLSHVTGPQAVANAHNQAADNAQNQTQFRAPTLEVFYNWLKPQRDLAVIMLSEQPKRLTSQITPLPIQVVREKRIIFTV